MNRIPMLPLWILGLALPIFAQERTIFIDHANGATTMEQCQAADRVNAANEKHFRERFEQCQGQCQGRANQGGCQRAGGAGSATACLADEFALDRIYHVVGCEPAMNTMCAFATARKAAHQTCTDRVKAFQQNERQRQDAERKRQDAARKASEQAANQRDGAPRHVPANPSEQAPREDPLRPRFVPVTHPTPSPSSAGPSADDRARAILKNIADSNADFARRMEEIREKMAAQNAEERRQAQARRDALEREHAERMRDLERQRDDAIGSGTVDPDALRPRYVPTTSADRAGQTNTPLAKNEPAISLPDFDFLVKGGSSGSGKSSTSSGSGGTPSFDDLLARAQKNPERVVSSVTGDVASRVAPFASIPFAMLDHIFVAQRNLGENLAGQIRNFESSPRSTDFVRQFGTEAFSPRKFLRIIGREVGGGVMSETRALATTTYSAHISQRWRQTRVSQPWWVVGSGVVFAPVAQEEGLADWWVTRLAKQNGGTR